MRGSLEGFKRSRKYPRIMIGLILASERHRCFVNRSINVPATGKKLLDQFATHRIGININVGGNRTCHGRIHCQAQSRVDRYQHLIDGGCITDDDHAGNLSGMLCKALPLTHHLAGVGSVDAVDPGTVFVLEFADGGGHTKRAKRRYDVLSNSTEAIVHLNDWIRHRQSPSESHDVTMEHNGAATGDPDCGVKALRDGDINGICEPLGERIMFSEGDGTVRSGDLEGLRQVAARYPLKHGARNCCVKGCTAG